MFLHIKKKNKKNQEAQNRVVSLQKINRKKSKNLTVKGDKNTTIILTGSDRVFEKHNNNTDRK